ncbi:hypothetical protein [Streptomyces sp. TP-A0874]|uniref:hypothetical protein n=1 Tax=Streptomyces sp. TP-A0874 TaxID=549819 RepID=UPI000853B229|nr:hypothetical protein [Streptomyces sp. TP-A0874]
MRIRSLGVAALAVTSLFTLAGAAAADSPEPSASAEGEAGPTEAGTTFRTATAIEEGRKATAVASTGDYLYWVFPVGAGRTATAEATVTLPDSASRHGEARWRLDVFDGLRRRQACVSGDQAVAAAKETESVSLSCTLRTVRAWAEPWSSDPLPGAYYLRLTVVDGPDEDLGLPVRAEIEARTEDAGGSSAVGGDLAAPLTPVVQSGAEPGNEVPDGSGGEEPEPSPSAARSGERDQVLLAEPEGGWSGWWSSRWLWTGGGGVLAALAGVAGYSLTRRPRGV